jgi:multiple sugar transport system substrate-binding protein
MKRIAVVIMIAVLIAGTAWSSGTSESAGPADGKETSQKAQLELWTYWDDVERQAAWYEILDGFREENPNVELTVRFVPSQQMVQQISVAYAGDSLPDVIQMDNPWVASFAQMGVLADITDRIEESIDLSKYYNGPANSSRLNGQLYGLPLTSNNICLYYNKEKLAAAGYEEPPKDWDEYLEYAKKLTSEDSYGLAISLPTPNTTAFQFLPYVWMAGSDIDSLDSSGTIQALELVEELVESGAMSKEVLTWSQGDTANQFIQQRAAMYVEGPWRLSTLENETEFDWGVAKLPEGPETFSSVLGGENITMTTAAQGDAATAEAAWRLLEFTQREENVLKLNLGKKTIPPRQDIAESHEFYTEGPISVFADMAQYARPRGPHPEWPKFAEAINKMVQSVVVGESEPAEAAETAAEEVARYLQ